MIAHGAGLESREIDMCSVNILPLGHTGEGLVRICFARTAALPQMHDIGPRRN